MKFYRTDLYITYVSILELIEQLDNDLRTFSTQNVGGEELKAVAGRYACLDPRYNYPTLENLFLYLPADRIIPLLPHDSEQYNQVIKNVLTEASMMFYKGVELPSKLKECITYFKDKDTRITDENWDLAKALDYMVQCGRTHTREEIGTLLVNSGLSIEVYNEVKRQMESTTTRTTEEERRN